jgi:hypothetical protein
VIERVGRYVREWGQVWGRVALILAAGGLVLLLLLAGRPLTVWAAPLGEDGGGRPPVSAEALEAVLFLAVVAELVVGYALDPVRRRWPDGDLWWAPYLYMAVGLGLGIYARVDLFSGLFAEPLVGNVITGLLIGGGPALVRKIAEGVAAVRLGTYQAGWKDPAKTREWYSRK